MKNAYLLVLPLVASFALTSVSATRPQGTALAEISLQGPPSSSVTEYVNPNLPKLFQYLQTSMLVWAPPSALSTDYTGVAEDIARVVLSEPPLWKDDTSHARTGILLLSLAFFESGFRAYVDDLRCNTWANMKFAHKKLPNEADKLLRLGHCDGGLAYSMWQIHPIETPEWEAVKIRSEAARLALKRARMSLAMSGDLRGYSGEQNGFEKARKRLEFAEKWSRKHPFDAAK